MLISGLEEAKKLSIEHQELGVVTAVAIIQVGPTAETTRNPVDGDISRWLGAPLER